MKPASLTFSLLFLLALVSSFSPAGSSVSIGNLNHGEIPLLPGLLGPERIAFDCNGAPRVGLADGQIFKFLGRHYGWQEFATISPHRPRAQQAKPTNPRVAGHWDSSFTPKLASSTWPTHTLDLSRSESTYGGLGTQVATSAEGVPFRFLNALDISPITGWIYFTDTSTIYQRREWEASVSSGDHTGRLMRFDPVSKNMTVFAS